MTLDKAAKEELYIALRTWGCDEWDIDFVDNDVDELIRVLERAGYSIVEIEPST